MVECCKQSLKEQSSKSHEHSPAESNADYEDPAQEVSERNNINNWARAQLSDILAENLTEFTFAEKLVEEKI